MDMRNLHLLEPDSLELHPACDAGFGGASMSNVRSSAAARGVRELSSATICDPAVGAAVAGCNRGGGCGCSSNFN